MKIIVINGENDFDAMTFEENFKPDLATWKKLKKDGILIDQEKELEIYGQALEFGDIDPDFIDFIKNSMIDYDIAKTANFYEVNE